MLYHVEYDDWYAKIYRIYFMFIGTQYYSAYVSLLNTLNFWKIVGGDVIRGYCYNMIRKVGEILYVLLYAHHVL